MKTVINCMIKLWQVISVPDSLLSLFTNREVDVLFVLPDANKSLLIDDKLFSPHIDPLVLKLSGKYKCISIARPFTKLSKSSFYLNTLTFNWLYILMRGAIWKLILSRFQPKMVIGIDLPKDLVVLAKKKGFYVVEVYHGFGRGASNAVYFSKFDNESEKVEWPSGIVVFDSQTYTALLDMLPEQIEVLLARNYWFDFLDLVGQEHLDITRKKLAKAIDKFDQTVLISLQHGYDGSRDHLSGILENGLIHEEVLSLIRDRSDILFIIKPHPVQVAAGDWGEVSQFFLNLELKYENVVFEAVTNTDIISLLMLSEAHITMCSSTIAEAGLLGVHSVGLCPTLQPGGVMQDAFKDIEGQGLFTRARLNVGELERLIHLLTQKRNKTGKGVPKQTGRVMAKLIADKIERGFS